MENPAGYCDFPSCLPQAPVISFLKMENPAGYCDFFQYLLWYCIVFLPENGKPCGVLRRPSKKMNVVFPFFLKMENPAGYCD